MDDKKINAIGAAGRVFFMPAIECNVFCVYRITFCYSCAGIIICGRPRPGSAVAYANLCKFPDPRRVMKTYAR